MYYIKKAVTHVGLAVLEAALISLLVVGLIAGTAFAARGGGSGVGGGKTGSGGGTLALVVLDADGVANYGNQVTFNVSTTATDRPFVSLKCYQGSLVYSASVGFFADYPWSKSLTLASSYWTGGGADCTAALYYMRSNGSTTTLATTSFYVAA